MRVLLLTRYDRRGASSRLRSLQFIPWLSRAGLDIEVRPLLSDAYLEALYSGGRRLGQAFEGFATRVRTLRERKGFDLLWIEKELFPWLPHWFELPWLQDLPFVLDYDDAIFHNYDRNWALRAVLGRKTDELMKLAALVTVGSRYLASRARGAGANQVVLLPTAVDLERYRPKIPTREMRCVIGWIGTPQTARYLHQIGPALAQLCRSVRARVLLIGSGPISLREVDPEVHPWSESTEQEELCLADVGVMPLPDRQWERGKCGYKLIQYMAAGLPVVASPVGANAEIVEHGLNGFLAETESDWVHYLTLLSSDPDLRARMGAAGRRKVEELYCTTVVAPKLLDALCAAARPGRS